MRALPLDTVMRQLRHPVPADAAPLRAARGGVKACTACALPGLRAIATKNGRTSRWAPRGPMPARPAQRHTTAGAAAASRRWAALSIALAASAAGACEPDSVPIFNCVVADGRKFIELCASSPPTPSGHLTYRFGRQHGDESTRTAELAFPAQRPGSLNKFFGATYTFEGVYTQSIRFETASHAYTVFTRSRTGKAPDEHAGVAVKAKATGKVSTVACSERPRFYIFALKGLLACDPDTPVGRACIRLPERRAGVRPRRRARSCHVGPAASGGTCQRQA